MNVRWTTVALRDLESIHSYIAADSADAAAATVQKIYEAALSLGKHPYIGRRGRIAATRELVIPPYLISYRIRRGVVELNAIVHSSRRWP